MRALLLLGCLILNGVVSTLASEPVVAGDSLNQTNANQLHLSERDLVWKAVEGLLTQESSVPGSQSVVPVIGVKLTPTDTGLEIILETSAGQSLQADIRSEGNTAIAEIPNAVLQLPKQEEFRAENPTPSIMLVTVTQVDADRIQVTMTAAQGTPMAQMAAAESGLVLNLTAQAGSEVEQAADPEEEEIVVTSTRSPLPIQQSPANVTVIDAEDVQRTLTQDIRDLIRYEPGLSVQNDVRFGIQDFTIRGVSGNRVLTQVDGIRQPARFEFGPFQIGRNYFDLSTLETVEIIRGPASALYGSDALGGVVSFFTPDPSDLLKLLGKDSFTRLATTFSSANLGFTNSVTQANRFGPVEFLFIYTRRDSQETRVEGDNSFVDPRDVDSNNYFGKLVYRIKDNHQIRFTGEALDLDTDTQFREVNLASTTQVATTQSFREEIRQDRTRFSLDYEYNPPANSGIVSFARAQIYFQDAIEREINRERRISQGTPFLRNSENSFVDRVLGGGVQLRHDFNTGEWVKHRLTYGLDASTTRNERPRDRVQTNLNTGAQTRIIPPDVFPTKDFPDSDTLRLGVYLQNEIKIGSRFTVIPGVRFDYYDLATSPDIAFTRNGAQAVDFNDSAISPNLSLVYEVSSQIFLVGRYARGFRAPLFNEINSGFTNLTGRFFKYRTIPNPALESETSDTFEIGVRGALARANFSFTGFYTAYKNFIEQNAPAGIEILSPRPRPPETAIVNIFQTQNIGDARIYGIEARGEYRLSRGSHGFSLIGALAWTQGENQGTGDPLASVDPFQLVAGLRYRAPENRWGIEFIGTYVGRPNVNRLFNGLPRFIPDDYIVFDLLGYYNISSNFSLNVGIFNLFDQKYFRYADVRNLNERLDIDRFAQPGINARVGLTVRF